MPIHKSPLPNWYLTVSRGRTENHNCQPPHLGTGRTPGGQRPGFIRGQDTSAVGERGAREVVWATSLREAAQAAVTELCRPNPGGIAGVCRAGRGAGCVPSRTQRYPERPQPAGSTGAPLTAHGVRVPTLDAPQTGHSPGLLPRLCIRMKSWMHRKDNLRLTRMLASLEKPGGLGTHVTGAPSAEGHQASAQPERKSGLVLCQLPAGWEPRARR